MANKTKEVEPGEEAGGGGWYLSLNMQMVVHGPGSLYISFANCKFNLTDFKNIF